MASEATTLSALLSPRVSEKAIAKQAQQRQRLAAASTEELTVLAHYTRPRWSTITVAAIAVEQWEEVRANVTTTTTARELASLCDALLVLHDLELLESATLADARKLIAAFCVTIPKHFDFAALERVPYTRDDEATTPISDVLDADNCVLVVYHHKRKGVKSQSTALDERQSAGADARLQSSESARASRPAFSLVHQFGNVRATADIYIKRTEGVTIQMHSFSADAHHTDAHSSSVAPREPLTIRLDAKALAQRVAMTLNTVQVLLSSTRGQTAVLQKVLAQLQLDAGSDTDTIAWTWCDPTEADASGDDIQLSKTKRSPLKPPPRDVPVLKAAYEDAQAKPARSDERKAVANKSARVLPTVEAKPPPRPAPAAPSTADSLEIAVLTAPTAAAPLAPDKSSQERAVPTPRSAETHKTESTKSLGKEVVTETESLRTLRSCLEVATRALGRDIPSSMVDQVVFTEFMLRNHCSSSLPDFVKDVRNSIREVFRSYSLSETLATSAAVLWAGLRIALWDAKISSLSDHFRAQALKSIESLQSKLVKARFDGFESAQLPVLSKSIVALLLCLWILADGPSAAPAANELPPVEDIIASLALNDVRLGKKRLQVFRIVNDAGKLKKRDPLLPKRSVEVLRIHFSALTDTLQHSPFTSTDETLYNARFLRSIAATLFSILEFDLCRSVQLSIDDGESPMQVQNTLRGILKGPGIAAPSTAFLEHALRLGDVFEGFAAQHETATGLATRRALSKLVPTSENLRWLKVDKDARAIAMCSHNNRRLRWFIESSSLVTERFVFAGEEDLVFEWIYIDQDVAASTKGAETQLLQRALSAWSAQPPDASATIQVATAKSAVGVNFRHVDKLESLAARDFAQLLLLNESIEHVALGCAVSSSDAPHVVILRAYADAKSAGTRIASLPALLEQSLQRASLLRCVLLHGGLPFLRMCALRETMRKNEVISLQHAIALGSALPQRVFEAALVACSSSPELLCAPQISHYALVLILQQGVSAELASAYLSGLLALLTSSDDNAHITERDVITDLVNQRFAYAVDGAVSTSAKNEADVYDVYDVLWLIATAEHLDSNCRALSQRLAIRVFFRPSVMTTYRVLRYSMMIPLEDMALDPTLSSDPVAMRAICSTRSYFSMVISILARTNKTRNTKPTEDMAVLPSQPKQPQERAETYLQSLSYAARTGCFNDLLLRYFTVLERPSGLSLLGLPSDLVNTMLGVLRDPQCFELSMRVLVAQCACSIAQEVHCDHALRSDVVASGLVCRLLEVVWDIDDANVGSIVLHALARFQICTEFRIQVITALGRVARQTETTRDAILSDILPTLERAQSIGDSTSAPRPFFSFVMEQHARTEPCACFAREQPVDESARRAIVVSYARKFVDSTISHAMRASLQRMVAGLIGQPRRLQSLAAKLRKAAKIQRSFFRWLYVSRRGAGVLTKVDAWWICAKCVKTPSFLAGVVICLRETAESFALSSPRAAGTSDAAAYAAFIEGVVGFIGQLARNERVCAVLSHVFRIEYALLKLTSHSAPPIRRSAMRALAELCWRSSSSMTFVCSRLTQPIWENYDFSSIWQKQDKKFCSWIEFAIRIVLERFTLATPAVRALGSENSMGDVRHLAAGSSHTLLEPALSDIDAVSTLLLVLSFDSENVTIIRKIAPAVAKCLSKVRTCMCV